MIERIITDYLWYTVSDEGVITSYKRYREGRVLKVDLVHGYEQVTLYNAKGSKKFRIHQLVAQEFIGPIPSDKPFVCHNDGNKRNNRVSNLRYGTAESNEADKIIHGTAMIGVGHVMCKLSEKQVIEIRRCCAAGETQLSVASDFGICQSNVSAIVTLKNWKHL